MRPAAGELLHFSEDPTIEHFVPHVAATTTRAEPMVWAVDVARAPDYWFPRQCPRALAWVGPATIDADRDRILSPGRTRVHVVEYGWLEAMRTVELFAYRLPAGPFRPVSDDDPHAFVATTPVDPLGPAERVGDLFAPHDVAGIDLRVLDNPWATRQSRTRTTCARLDDMAIKIAISSYSFHRFGGGPEGKEAPTVESMIDRCAALGVSGIEILWEHLVLNGQDNVASAHELHQYAALRGITPVTLAASHNPVQLTAEGRAVELDKLIATIDVAEALGTPFVRVHGGRWHTLSNFHDMWDNLGEEPPAEGYTIDEGYDWAIEALTTATAHAAERGITLGLENHWGLTGTAKGCQRIHDAVDSPWFKYILDIGNYFQHPDPYAEMTQALTDLAVIHGKFYLGGGIIVEPEIDYTRVATLLAGINYTGFISLEFEGKAHPDQGVPDAIATVRSAFGI